MAIVLVGAVVAVGAAAYAYWAVEGKDPERFDAGIKAATAVAALAAAVLTWGRLELSRHEHHLAREDHRLSREAHQLAQDQDQDLTERYSRAIEQVGNGENLFVRIGGIYALERYALDASRSAVETDWRVPLDVLSSLARELSSQARKAGQLATATDDETARADPPRAVIGAVRVLGRFAERSGRPAPMATAHQLAGVLLQEADLIASAFPSGDAL